MSKAFKFLNEKVQKNFNASSGKLENLHFDVLLLLRVSTDELFVITLKNYAKLEEKLTCALKNYIRNLANF